MSGGLAIGAPGPGAAPARSSQPMASGGGGGSAGSAAGGGAPAEPSPVKRQRVPWQPEEEAALRKGVQRHGAGGAWAKIRTDPEFQAILSRRSGTQLKDKWRNLVMHGHVSIEEMGANVTTEALAAAAAKRSRSKNAAARVRAVARSRGVAKAADAGCGRARSARSRSRSAKTPSAQAALAAAAAANNPRPTGAATLGAQHAVEIAAYTHAAQGQGHVVPAQRPVAQPMQVTQAQLTAMQQQQQQQQQQRLQQKQQQQQQCHAVQAQYQQQHYDQHGQYQPQQQQRGYAYHVNIQVNAGAANPQTQKYAQHQQGHQSLPYPQQQQQQQQQQQWRLPQQQQQQQQYHPLQDQQAGFELAFDFDDVCSYLLLGDGTSPSLEIDDDVFGASRTTTTNSRESMCRSGGTPPMTSQHVPDDAQPIDIKGLVDGPVTGNQSVAIAPGGQLAPVAALDVKPILGEPMLAKSVAASPPAAGLVPTSGVYQQQARGGVRGAGGEMQ